MNRTRAMESTGAVSLAASAAAGETRGGATIEMGR